MKKLNIVIVAIMVIFLSCGCVGCAKDTTSPSKDENNPTVWATEFSTYEKLQDVLQNKKITSKFTKGFEVTMNSNSMSNSVVDSIEKLTAQVREVQGVYIGLFEMDYTIDGKDTKYIVYLSDGILYATKVVDAQETKFSLEIDLTENYKSLMDRNFNNQDEQYVYMSVYTVIAMSTPKMAIETVVDFSAGFDRVINVNKGTKGNLTRYNLSLDFTAADLGTVSTDILSVYDSNKLSFFKTTNKTEIDFDGKVLIQTTIQEYKPFEEEITIPDFIGFGINE